MLFNVGNWRQGRLVALERIRAHLALHRALIPAPPAGLDAFLKDFLQGGLSQARDVPKGG